MKMKKTVSAIAALAMSVSAFAGLGITANAESVTAFTQNFTGESTDPSEYGFTKLTETEGAIDSASKIEDKTTLLSSTSVSNGVLSNTAGGSNNITATSEYYASFDPIGVGNEVTVTYTWSYGNATGNSSNHSETYLADENGEKIITIEFYGNNTPNLRVNGKTVGSLSTSDRNKTIAVSITLDMNSKKVTALSLGDYYSSDTAIDFQSEATSISRFGFGQQARVLNWNNTTSVDNITISYEEAKVPVDTVSVKYVTSDGSEISTTILDNVYESYTDDDNKTQYRIKDISTLYVGDEVYIPWQKYILSDEGILYETTHSNSGPYYGTLTTLSQNHTMEKIVSAVSFADGSKCVAAIDCDGDSTNNASIRASNMSAGRGDISLGYVEPGIYTVSYNQYIRGGDPKLYIDDSFICDLETHPSSWGETKTENITITQAGELTIKSIDMTDYILLIKTGDYTPPTPEPVTTDATHVNSYKNSDDDKASLWQATINLDGSFTARTIQASVTDNTGTIKTSESVEITNITTEGSVFAAIVVDGRTVDEIQSVKVTLN